MPSITTIATSPIAGRGLNRGPRTNIRFDPSLVGDFWFQGDIDGNNSFHDQAHFYFDQACTMPATRLPSANDRITLLSNAEIYPDPAAAQLYGSVGYGDCGISTFALLEVTNFTLYIKGHTEALNPNFDNASDEDKLSGAVPQFSCDPIYQIDITCVRENGEIPEPGWGRRNNADNDGLFAFVVLCTGHAIAFRRNPNGPPGE